MLESILAAALALQDPPAAKTVEEHLKRLEDRVASLEQRQKALTDENAQLEKKLADAKAAKEAYARQAAQAWVRRYGPAAGLTEAQSGEIEALWRGWVAKDQESPPAYWDPGAAATKAAAAWKPREDALRAKLSPEQAGRLAAKVREEQEQLARTSLGAFVKDAKIDAERVPALEKAALSRLRFPEGALLLQARPDERIDWFKVLGAVEESLADLEAALSAEEMAALRATVTRWKPKARP